MIPVAEFLADVHQVHADHPPHEVHGDLSGGDHLPAPALAPEHILVDVVGGADIVYHRLSRGNILVVFLDHIPDGLENVLLSHGAAHEVVVGQNFIQRALDLPDVGGDILRDEVGHRVRQFYA